MGACQLLVQLDNQQYADGSTTTQNCLACERIAAGKEGVGMNEFTWAILAIVMMAVSMALGLWLYRAEIEIKRLRGPWPRFDLASLQALRNEAGNRFKDAYVEAQVLWAARWFIARHHLIDGVEADVIERRVHYNDQRDGALEIQQGLITGCADTRVPAEKQAFYRKAASQHAVDACNVSQGLGKLEATWSVWQGVEL